MSNVAKADALTFIFSNAGSTYTDVARGIGLSSSDARSTCEEMCRDGAIFGHKAGRQRLFRYSVVNRKKESK